MHWMRFAVISAALALSAGGAHAQNEAALTPREIRAAANELAGLMQQRYVFPDDAARYAAHLRAQAGAGAYDGLTDPEQFAATLQTELRAVHDDAHLRVAINEGAEPGHARRLPAGDPIGGDAWLADGVGYFQIRGLPGSAASVAAMTRIVDEFAAANTLIIDLRSCPGGGLSEMDVLFSRLFAEPTHLVTMDTRAAASAELDEVFSASPTLHRVDAPSGITRREHWAAPASPPTALRNARVFLLTDFTASACEHLSLALKASGRATLVGATTRGAGHYGGDVSFGGDRFSVFLPVGRTYDPKTGWDWEGAGITPDQQVAPDDALTAVLRDIGAPAEAANRAPPLPRPAVRVVATGQPRYGIAMMPPRQGEASIRVMEVMAGLPAEAGGLRANDRIVSVNGTAVAALAPDALDAAMHASPLTLEVERGGQQLTLELRLAQASSSTSQ